MPREVALSRLQEIAHRASKIRPVENAEIALANFFAGALHALYQAAKLDYDDSRANPNPDASIQEFKHSVISISQGSSPADEWLAGFYFTSALFRMPSLIERINKHACTGHDIPALRRLVNKIKHEPDAQMGRPWQFTLVDAVDALEMLCGWLEDSLEKEQG